MQKTYVWYNGGFFGDLVCAIANNGNTLPLWMQFLKTTEPLQSRYVGYLNQHNIHTFGGSSQSPLEWGWRNIRLYTSDPEQLQWIAKRYSLLNVVDMRRTLGHYYPEQDLVDLTQQQELDLLAEQLNQYPDHDFDASIDISQVNQKEDFLHTLGDFWQFDSASASQIYDFWQNREQTLVEKYQGVC